MVAVGDRSRRRVGARFLRGVAVADRPERRPDEGRPTYAGWGAMNSTS